MSLSLRAASQKDLPLAQSLFEQAPTYFVRLDGSVAGPDAAAKTFAGKPSGNAAFTKHMFVIEDGGAAIYGRSEADSRINPTASRPPDGKVPDININH